MTGRDPHEHERAATPLELLYDLTIVVAFSISGSQFAHLLAEGHVVEGIVAFCFSVFAMCWAWITFTWFVSAYDTDDWLMRAMTLLQMLGIVVLALGLADIYHGFEEWELHNEVMVAGYVIMRVSMIVLWLRAARDDESRAPALRGYAFSVGLAQVGWVALILLHLTGPILWISVFVLYAIEIGGVVLAERRSQTPWHAHHIAERYGLLLIISIGEIVLGTTVAVEALVAEAGWSTEAVLVVIAGLAIAFGIWWSYFGIRWGEMLDRRWERGFGFQAAHLVIYGAIAALGAGLHVAALYIEGEGHISEAGVIATIVVPILILFLALFAAFHFLLPGRDRFHYVLLGLCALVLAASWLMANAGVPLGWCLVVAMLAPWVVVAGYETRGADHQARMLEE